MIPSVIILPFAYSLDNNQYQSGQSGDRQTKPTEPNTSDDNQDESEDDGPLITKPDDDQNDSDETGGDENETGETSKTHQFFSNDVIITKIINSF